MPKLLPRMWVIMDNAVVHRKNVLHALFNFYGINLLFPAAVLFRVLVHSVHIWVRAQEDVGRRRRLACPLCGAPSPTRLRRSCTTPRTTVAGADGE
jgi:hypothetical protein